MKIVKAIILLLCGFAFADSAYTMAPRANSFSGGLSSNAPATTPHTYASMIRVEHGLYTSHMIIDGNRQTPLGYNLLRDILDVFHDSNWASTKKGDSDECLSDTPSVTAKNLSAKDALSFFEALDAILMNPRERKHIVAIYLNNVEINATSANMLVTILGHNRHLQNLWLNNCTIEGNTPASSSTPSSGNAKLPRQNALDSILQGVISSPNLRSFWLLDANTDFRMPPAN